MEAPISSGPNLPKVRIGESKAEKIWNAEGVLKREGGRKTRVTIGAATDRNRFAVAAKTFERNWWGSLKAKIFGHGYVELKVGGDSRYKDKIILLKIDSLVKRSHLSKEQIVSASKRDDFALLRAIDTAVQRTEEAIAAFESSKNVLQTGLKPENLMKAVKFALERKDANPNGVLIQKKLKPSQTKEFVLKFNPDTKKMAVTNLPTVQDKNYCDVYNVDTNSFTKVNPPTTKKTEAVRKKKLANKKTVLSKNDQAPTHNKVEEHYNRLVSQFFKIKDGELFFTNENRLGLKEEQLKKIIDIALKNPTFEYNIKITEGQGQTKQVSRFLLHFDEKDKLRFTYVEPKVLGEGSYAKVFSAIDFETVEFEALKIQKKDHQGKISDFNDHEFNIVRKLQPDQKIRGIQSKPRKIVQIKKIKVANGEILERSTKYGIFAPKADADYITRTDGVQGLPLKTILSEQVQLLEGLAYMHSQGVVHLDIKPENVLVTEKEVIEIKNGKKEVIKENMVDLADFGGAVDLSEPNKDNGLAKDSWKKVEFTYTPEFVIIDEVGKLQSLQKSKDPQAKEEFEKLAKACDSFALGVTLFSTLIYNSPFPQTTQSWLPFPSQNRFYNLSKNPVPHELIVSDDANVNKAINEILRGLLNVNPDKRWDAKRALDKYNKIIKTL